MRQSKVFRHNIYSIVSNLESNGVLFTVRSPSYFRGGNIWSGKKCPV